MNRKLIFYVLVVFLFSCNQKTEKAHLEAERDSVKAVNDRLNFFIDAIANSIDSITMQEGILKMPSGDGLLPPSREQIRENLSLFEELLNRQKQRISELEDSLAYASDAQFQKLNNIIKFLNEQIKQKDGQIAQLRKELDNKNVNIAQLQSRVSNLTEDVSNLNQINQEQEQALTAQSDMMNEGYIKIGTKKELQSIGLLSKGGLFSKKKLNISNLDPNVFEKIDIREFHTLTINGKSPKILTQIPETSYQITKNSDGTSTLTISDPTLFWSVSNFLIIQCK